MSGTNAEADSIRAAVAAESLSITTLETLFANGTETNVSNNGTADAYLQINNSTGATTSPLFLSTGFSFIENVNDTSPVIASGTDGATTTEFYQGDAAGQTFYTGTGNVFVAMTGFGNTVATPVTGGGTYTIVTGLANAAGDQTMLAPAASVGGVEQGNTIAAASGDYNIAAGLGANVISLGSGNDTVASEGNDTITGGSGAAQIDATGNATVFAGLGALTYNGAGGTGLIIGDGDSTSGPLAVYGGTGPVTVFGGGGDVNAFGGSSGGNTLVSGSANSVLVGGGSNDLLVATGSGTTTMVAGSGNETLFGGGATGTTNIFAGDASSSDTIVLGTGSEYIQFGAGNSTVFGGGGNDVYGLVNDTTTSALSGGTDLVVGFNAAQDFFQLQGFDSSTSGSSVLASDTTVANGSTIIQLSDNVTIDLYGVTNLTASNFI